MLDPLGSLEITLSSMVAITHMRLFKWRLIKIQFLIHTSHISGVHWPLVARGYRSGQHRGHVHHRGKFRWAALE